MLKRCKICKKSVYPQDPQINLDGSVFHKMCAKCEDCSTQITTSNFRKYENGDFVTLVCVVHYNTRVVDRGNQWFTSTIREREIVAGTKAAEDGANRRGSLVALSGSGFVQSVTPTYAAQRSPTYSPKKCQQKLFSSVKSFKEVDKMDNYDELKDPPCQRNDIPSTIVDGSRYVDETAIVSTGNSSGDIEDTGSYLNMSTVASPNTQPITTNDSQEMDEIVKIAYGKLKNSDEMYGKLDPRSIELAEMLGTDLKRSDYHADAEILYRAVLERRVEAFGENHADSINALSMLADLLHKTRNLEESARLYRRALALREESQGLDHEATLYEVNDLACVLTRTKQYSEAEELYKRALSSRENVLGPENEDTLITVHDYAALLEETNRYEESEAFYNRAVAGREQALGPEHSDTLDSITCLALLLQTMGDDAAAEAMYLRAMDACERAHGPSDKHTCDMAYNLGNMYEDQKEYGKAAEMYEYAVSGYTISLGSENEETIEAVDKLEHAKKLIPLTEGTSL